MCKYCDKALKRSIYQQDPQTHAVLKSCPGCSMEAGYHVYYPSPQTFGCSVARVNSKNQQGIQSHCKYCRAKRFVPNTVKSFSCMRMNA